MRIEEQDSGLLVVSLSRGDALRSSLEGLAAQRGVAAAWVSAIGAIEDPELGYYDLAQRSYVREAFAGIWELASFSGSLTLFNDKPMLHAHVALAGRDLQLRGGHLFDAKVGVMVEAFVRPLQKPIRRRMFEEVGLPGWDL